MPLPPLNVLLVEDNPINQKVASRLLEKHGHRVVIAGNGKEALALLGMAGEEAPAGEAPAPFDLVLMDVQMPEMDGLSATAVIRRQERGAGRRLPIVALTAHAMKGDRELCLEAGMDAYVSKPVHPQALLQAMSDALAPGRPCADAS